MHPLDRPAWSALKARWAPLARSAPGVLQLDPAYGPFAGADDGSARGLEALEPGPDGLWLVEPEAVEAPPGMTARTALCVQMLAGQVEAGEPGFPVEPLGDADGPQMLALARLTRPGPFSTLTHRLGGFVGVKAGGRLVAMAGERMTPDGFTEVSGVCTHPDHRGRGYARGLMRLVAQRILARGEGAFLHAYESNAGAIALYETLGFRLRRKMVVTMLTRP